MNTARCLGIGYALHAMNARFVFEFGEGAAAVDFGDDFFIAAHRAFARGHQLDLPSLLGGIALVHAEQVAGEQGGLVSAGAGADFENHIALVHRVLGQKRKPQPMLECGAPGLELGLFRFRNRAHFRIGRRIGHQARHAFKLVLGRAIGFHRFHDRRQLGEFAREPDVSLRRNRRGEFAFERSMAGDERVEFLIG